MKCNLTYQQTSFPAQRGVSYRVLLEIESQFYPVKGLDCFEITPGAFDCRLLICCLAVRDTAYISGILETAVTDVYSRLFIRHPWNCLKNTSNCDIANVAVTELVPAGYRSQAGCLSRLRTDTTNLIQGIQGTLTPLLLNPPSAYQALASFTQQQ